jgi:hypothetical protein
MRDLNNIASTINAPSFGNAFLQNPAIYNYQFTTYNFGVNVRENINKPAVVYDVKSFEKYTLNEDLEGEFWLKYIEIDEDLPLFAELSDVEENGFFNYKKQSI